MAYDIPVYGTMAHSFVQAHTDETTAFEHFALAQPEHAVLLIDTYDTEAAAHKVVVLARDLKQQGITVKGVRLDSGYASGFLLEGPHLVCHEILPSSEANPFHILLRV